MKVSGKRIGLCIKDADRRVLEQNDHCKRTCGHRIGSVCEEGCMTRYPKSQKEGIEVIRSLPLFGKDVCDAIVVNDSDQLTTLFYSLRDKYADLLKHLDMAGLTPRQKDLYLLAMEGLSNAQIADRLKISPATVKTHMKNIAKKLPSRPPRFHLKRF